MNYFRRVLLASAALCLALMSALPAVAQLDTATIMGTATDPSGAVIANAAVKITNTRTGRTYEATTDDSGSYVVTSLPVGMYKVEIAREGFAPGVVQDVVLHTNENRRVDVALKVGGVGEEVAVTAERTTVNTANSEIATTIDATRVTNLPLNGRDFTGLLALVPGSVTSGGFGQTSLGGFETSLAGVNILLDGADATRIDINATSTQMGRQESRISRASVDSIQEFRVMQSTYSAEFGRSMGDVVNVITKSGGNQFHGNIFEFFRDDALDAQNYFATGDTPLRLNQFGGNLSGPLKADKLFFFVNYEGLRQSVTRPVEAQVLNAATRALAVPSMLPVINAIPLGNGGPVLDSLGNPTPRDYFFGSLTNTLREDTGSVRLDWLASDSDTIYVRYNINDSYTETEYGIAEGQVSPSTSTNHLLKVSWAHTFSSTLLNEVGFAWNRPQSDSLGGGGAFPIFQCFFCDETNNFGVAPGPALFSVRSPQYSLQFVDTVSWVKGRHTVKFGGDIRFNNTKRATEPQRFLSYAGANDFVNNAGFALSTLGYDMIGVSNSNWNFFVQDDIRLARNFTVNLGLRYEYNTVLQGDEVGNFDLASLALLPIGEPLYEGDKNNFAPRIGFSWDPFSDGKMVFRAGYGMFYNPLLTGAALSLAGNYQPSFSINIIELLFGLRTCTPALNLAYPLPDVLPTCVPALPQNVNILDRDMRDSYAQHWSFSFQYELAKNNILEIAYVGNHGVKFPAGASAAGLELNRDPWLYSPLISPDFGNIRRLGNFLGTNYNAMNVSYRRHVGKGLNLDANYTWAHQFDNAVNIFSAFQNSADPSGDHSEGDIDVRHNFNAGLVYDVPVASWMPRKLAEGWQVSSIFQTRSGLPVNITVSSPFFGLDLIRPNIVPGVDIRPDNYNSPNNQLNPAAFVAPGLFEYGNLPRNAARGPSFQQVDLALSKTTSINERFSVQFRGEMFNLFNRPNFANPVSVLTDTNFGRSMSTIGNSIGLGTSRQAQLAVKLIF